MPSEKIKELLLKLKSLSKQGIGGEKDNAIEMLEKALKKYGLTLEDLENLEKKLREFKVKNKDDATIILVQCICDVFPNAKIQQHARNLTVYCHLDSAEFIEVTEKYKHYYKIWLKEKKEFLTAFVVKNNIGLSGESSGKDIDEEEKMAIIKKMNSMDENKFVDKNRKQLN